MYKNRLIIFTRYPEAGTAKTRLIPLLGADGAADLQRKMTEHTLSRMKGLTTSTDLTIEVRYDGGNKNLMKQWLGSAFSYASQGTGDLGERMRRAFEDAFKSGTTAVVIIGTDIPALTDNEIQQAFTVLKQKEMVLGPAKDGGYYLIGLQKNAILQSVSDLFKGIKWGGHDVLRGTLAISDRLGLTYSLLKEMNDVDRPEDLFIWERSQIVRYREVAPDGISVIIPTLNEADHIADTLANINLEKNIEVIVVDGGSKDNTVHIAKNMGAEIVYGSPPRSCQMNQGADAASKDILLFLHADTLLPADFSDRASRALSKPGVVAGAFELRIDSPIPSLRLIEHIANWRSRYLKMPYGDQAIFIRSKVFRQTSGFPNVQIMEDFEFVRRLQKIGDVVTLPVPVITSSRRWFNHGILKTTLINQLIVLSYFMGMSPNRIARVYRRNKRIVGEDR